MALFSRQLLAFMAVAEELHFGRAAQRLHISQPPLSQQLQQFEERIGVRLVDRTTRSVRLTAAGQVMLAALQRMAADGQSAIMAAQRVASGDAGSLRIGFTSTAAYRLVPAVVGAYRARYQDVHLTMEEFTSGILCDGLLRDRFDIALLRRYDDMPDDDLVFTEIDREPLVAALPPGHKLARRRAVPIELLGDTPVIGFAYATSQYFHTLLSELFAQNGVTVRYVMESVLPTILALVESGLGIAIVPASVRELRPEGIVYRPLAARAATDSVLYAAHRTDSINPAVGKFLEVMTQVQAARAATP
jgi:DNA-binding transcriptional LysR family regulator